MGAWGGAGCLCDEGGDSPQAVGEDHRADDCDKNGEEPLQVRDGQDVPVTHRAAKVLLHMVRIMLRRCFLLLLHFHPQR